MDRIPCWKSQVNFKRRRNPSVKGKLTKKEVGELRRTNSNIFDWVAKEKSKVEEKELFEKRVEDVDMEVDETRHRLIEKRDCKEL